MSLRSLGINPARDPLSLIAQPKEGSASSPFSEVTDSTFEAEVLKSNLPVLVYMSSPRYLSGPYNSFQSSILVVEKVAKDFNGKLKVVKLNVDENEQTVNDYRIHSVPTLILFKDGKVIDRVSAQVYNSLSSFAKNYLDPGRAYIKLSRYLVAE